MIAAATVLFTLASGAADQLSPPNTPIMSVPVPPPFLEIPRNSKWQVATPAASPGSWVTSADYPKVALRTEVQGVTRFRLNIGTGGRVTGCFITQSSGSGDLDEATCRLIAQRALFAPARDHKGKPRAGVYYNAVRWIIPANREPPEPGLLMRSFAIEPDGSMSDCLVASATGSAREEFQPGPFPCETNARFVEPRNSVNAPLRKRIIQTVEIRVDDVE